MRYAAAAALILLASCGTGDKPSPRPDPVEIRVESNPNNVTLPAFPAPPTTVPALIPGDLIEIKVFQQPDLCMTLRIPPVGSFNYPLIGTVRASGRTPGSLESLLRDKLGAKFLHDPSVTVTVQEHAPRMVYIMGGVQKPGSYPFPATQRMTILQLVSIAGGYTDRALKESAQIVRRRGNGSREVIALSMVAIEQAVAKGRANADLELQPDDQVVIQSAARVVHVLGYVKNAGPYDLPLDTRITASMAVSKAGGCTKFADPSNIQVLRRPPTGDLVKIPFDLDSFVEGNRNEDVELQPGDVIWVPEGGIW